MLPGNLFPFPHREGVLGASRQFSHIWEVPLHATMKHRIMVLFCHTPSHMSFISLQMNSTSHILPPFSLFTVQEWGMCCCPLQGQQSSSQRLPIPVKMVQHIPTKTKPFPQLYYYVTTKDLISNYTLIPGCPNLHRITNDQTWVSLESVEIPTQFLQLRRLMLS